VETITRPWGEIFSAEEVDQALQQRPVQLVAIVHAETSTGALQPLEEIAGVVHRHGAVMIVDAVTSLGGVPLLVDEWDLDVCYSGAQKCLSCPPGASPITLGPRAEDKLAKRKSKVANFYLDLSILQKYWGKERSYHHTAPISSNYALYEGLRLVAEEGLENRWVRHRKNAELLWQGLEDIGLSMHVPVEYRIPSLTTVRIPDGVEDVAIRKALLSQYNIEISGGFAELAGKVWRIGLMGFSSREENVLLLLSALKNLL
jgi:alanine-glyoxylate transaminase/serine-glyoxylate transaminase/serine-pyruvate transaminase